MTAVALSTEPPPIQGVVRARTETEAAWLVAEGRPGTRIIAGGTDLMLHIDRGRATPRALIDIRRSGMDTCVDDEDGLHIGATTTATQLSKWESLRLKTPSLWEAAATLSVPTIRNFATLGGNIANASPAADMVPAVLALHGTVDVRQGDSVRTIHAADVALAPGKTSLKETELLTRIHIPHWGPRAFHHFVKLGFRDAQVIAVTSLSLSVSFVDDVVARIGVALGSVAPRVKRTQNVEAFLVGKRLTRTTVQDAVDVLSRDISPIDDVRSEAAYRLLVSQNYLRDALVRAALFAENRQPTQTEALCFLRDPAPRPPRMRGERTDVLANAPIGKAGLRIVETSLDAFTSVEQNKLGVAVATKKKPAKATKKKPVKKAAKKSTKKAAKKKVAKKAKKKAAKKKVAKKKAKKKVAKKAKKKAGKKKASKKKSA